jgi:uncharacterized membrane protein YfcA
MAQNPLSPLLSENELIRAPEVRAQPRQPSVGREFLTEQFPLILAVLGAGFAAAYLQHGFLPGGDRAFPLAGVEVPIWHIVWMGLWTGYTMAVVGEAAGIFALPYQMSVLQFTSPHVTPTTQLLTFLNPFGALFGFRRAGQWNLDLALWVCLGGVVGGLIGPFIRSTVLARTEPFTFVVGLALMFTGIHLCFASMKGFRKTVPTDGLEAKFAAERASRRKAGLPPSAIPAGIGVETVAKGGGLLTIGFWGQTWTVSTFFLFVTGVLVGVISSALGVGGGFMLVPIFVAFYGLPIYVVVAATIPYVIVLSAVGLFTYGVIMPALTGSAIQPEWSWGFFAAAGGIFGAWAAAKTQRFVPEHFLKLMLGAVTGVVGALYAVSFFFVLPFRP